MNCLAIDNEDAYIGSGELLFSQNEVIIGNFKKATIEISFSRKAISSNVIRKVSAFITGYTISKPNLTMPLSLSIETVVYY